MCVNQNQLYTKTIYYTSFLSSLFYGIRASSLVRALSIQQPWLPKTPPKSLLYSLEKTRSTYFACHSGLFIYLFIWVHCFLHVLCNNCSWCLELSCKKVCQSLSLQNHRFGRHIYLYNLEHKTCFWISTYVQRYLWWTCSYLECHKLKMILLIQCLQRLGNELKEVVVAVRQREYHITFKELFDTLIEHENFLNSDEIQPNPSLVTTNVAHHNTKLANHGTNNRNNQHW